MGKYEGRRWSRYTIHQSKLKRNDGGCVLVKSSIRVLHKIISRRKSKKLKEAVLHWLGSGKEVIDETQDDAKAFGLKLPTEKVKKNKNNFEVDEDNWDAVMMFCNMQTQWSTSFGGFVGLKYEVLLMKGGMFDLYNITDRLKILEELQIMEVTALKELNKEKK